MPQTNTNCVWKYANILANKSSPFKVLNSRNQHQIHACKNSNTFLKAVLVETGGPCLWPWNPSKLRYHQTQKGKHRNATMLQFSLMEYRPQETLVKMVKKILQNVCVFFQVSSRAPHETMEGTSRTSQTNPVGQSWSPALRRLTLHQWVHPRKVCFPLGGWSWYVPRDLKKMADGRFLGEKFPKQGPNGYRIDLTCTGQSLRPFDVVRCCFKSLSNWM